MKIIKEKWYKCLRGVKISSIGYKHENFEFLKGKVYKSEEEGCITDENGKAARMDFIPELNFLKISNPIDIIRNVHRL